MSADIIPPEAVPYAAAATYAAFLTQLPPEVVLGSFAGSVIFLLGVKDKPRWQWMLYFLLAFLAGLLGGKPLCSIIEGLLSVIGAKVQLSHGLGAMFSAACTVNIVSWFRDNPSFLSRQLKNRRNNY